MTDQLEAHGLYVLFIAAVLLLVFVMAVDAIAQARRDRIRNRHNLERGLVAKSNREARLLG